ncbi:MAG TPA: sulfatase [Vicinamibacteria bacterium]|nr:sulfatase [Vicinamibacteria bacterium]
MPRSGIRGLAGFCLLAGCGSNPGLPPSLVPGSAAGYNLVLLTLDTTRADRLGAYGWEPASTPALDRLAEEGLKFTGAISPAPMTLPAHASILTGLDPPSHGVHHNGQFSLDESFTTIAERLESQGYDTAAFVSAFVLDGRYGLRQGFAVYDDQVEPAPGQAFGGLDSQRSARDVTERALAWLGTRTRQGPFFLWVHYYDPHAAYEPPEPFASQFAGAPYDGEIAYMDSEIDRILTSVRARAEPALIVAAGDHGESLGEHREPTHSRLIYDATQRVPMIWWSPGLIGGPLVMEDTVGLIDVFPTLLDVLGVEFDASSLDGRSLVRHHEEEDRALYMETMATYLDNGWSPLHGLRTQRAKYILAPRPEYYDLESDPGEKNNRYDIARSHADEALERLETLLKQKLGGMATAASIAEGARPVDPDALRRLQALGYLGGGGSADPSLAPDSLPDPKDMLPGSGSPCGSRRSTLGREVR